MAIASPGTRSSGTTTRRRPPSSTRTRVTIATTGPRSCDRVADGRIALWREWQHLDDAQDWDSRIQGPAADLSLLASIDHVQLGMPAGGEDAARAFYGGILGLREIPKPVELAGRGGAWFAGRAVAIHLGAEADFRAPPKAHPAFVVDDLAAVRERFGEAGIRTVDDDSGLAIRRCYVRDPFGNRLELVDASDAGFTSRPGRDESRD